MSKENPFSTTGETDENGNTSYHPAFFLTMYQDWACHVMRDKKTIFLALWAQYKSIDELREKCTWDLSKFEILENTQENKEKWRKEYALKYPNSE